MPDNKIFIDKVIEKFPTVTKTCRPVIAFFEKDGKDSAVNGFIIGNKYVINSATFVINNKSDFYLINYLDNPNEDDE